MPWIHVCYAIAAYKSGVVRSLLLSLRFLILALSILGTNASVVQPSSLSSEAAAVARRAGGDPSSTSSNKSSMVKYSRACSAGIDALLQHFSRQQRQNFALLKHRFRRTTSMSSTKLNRTKAQPEIKVARPAAEEGRSGFMIVCCRIKKRIAVDGVVMLQMTKWLTNREEMF